MAEIKIRDLTGRAIPKAGIELIANDAAGNATGQSSLFYTSAAGFATVPDLLLDENHFYRAFAPGYADSYSAADYLGNGSVITLEVYNSPAKWILLAAAATAIVVVGKPKKKKVGFLKNVPPIVQGGIVVGGLGVIAYLLLKGKDKDKLLPGQAGNRLKELQAMGIYPYWSNVQAESYASMLVNAFNDCGTDEAAVFHVFNEVGNEADLMLLIETFGTRTYTGCFEGSLFTDFTANLSQAMTAELSSSDLQEISAILQSKNINYSF